MAEDLLVFGDSLASESRRAVGIVWFPWQRRGDIARIQRALTDADQLPARPAFARVRRRSQSRYEALVEGLFERPWLHLRWRVVPADSDPLLGVAGLVAELERERPDATLRIRVAARRREAGVRGARLAELLGHGTVARELRRKDAPVLQLLRVL